MVRKQMILAQKKVGEENSQMKMKVKKWEVMMGVKDREIEGLKKRIDDNSDEQVEDLV